MLFKRPAAIRPLLIAALFLLLSFPTYITFRDHSPHWKFESSNWRPKLGVQNGIGEVDAVPSTFEPVFSLNEPETSFQLIEDAHKFPTADAFLPHFRAVTQMKGLTIADTKATCSWTENENVNFQYGPPADWVETDRSDEEIGFRRKQWHDFIRNELTPYESCKTKFEGRGIVILAGNGKSLKRVKVILRQLKNLGSQLPVEIHYWGDEMSLSTKKDLSSMWPKIYFNDLSAPSNIFKSNNDNFFHVNYQLKTAAVLNSRHAEILLLDSDNIPIIDPASLFDSDTYKEYGTLFWPDIARTRPQNPMWAITNTKCRMNEYEQESGQLLVDKRRFFYHLQLAAWFNNLHARYYNEFLLGDKDMFRFAWRALKTRYGFPPKWATSVGVVAPNDWFCGHSFAQHHPNGSVAFLHGGLLKTIPNAVMKWHRANRGGIFQVYKRSVVDEQHNFIERVGIRMDNASDLPDRPKDISTQWCTDMYDVNPRKLDEIVPGFQKTFEDLGGYWMLDEDKDDHS